MRIDVLSIFPDYLGPLRLSLVGKAIETGLVELKVRDLRDWTHDRHRTVDDTPYGGGAGMVMRPEPWGEALDELLASEDEAEPSSPGGLPPRFIILSPSGRPFDQQLAGELAGEERLILACGRYEGIDARVAGYAETRLRTDEVSIGDYVLNGGEAAALAVIEAVVRLIPGVIGNPESLTEESHAPGHDALLEYPLYTKPPSWRGLDVPPILFSGHHAQIAGWRREQALDRTRRRRPDLLPPDRQPVVVAIATLNDAGELLTLQRAAYLSEGRRDGSFEIPPLVETLEDVTDVLNGPKSELVLVARRDGRILGSVRARIGPVPQTGTDERSSWLIGRLMVVPDQQGEGLGSLLMTAIEEQAPENCEMIRLFAGAASTANQTFYARRGFVEIGREVHQPSGVELVHLAKAGSLSRVDHDAASGAGFPDPGAGREKLNLVSVLEDATLAATRTDVRRPVLGVRHRSVLVAVLVVGLALVAGGILLLVALQTALTNTTQSALESRARDVSALASEQGVDQQGMVAVGRELRQDRIRGQEVQIIDSAGRVVASSDRRLNSVMAPQLIPAAGQVRNLPLPNLAPIGDDDDYLVVGYGFAVDQQTYVVQVAGSIQIQADTVRTVSLLLFGGAPLLLAVVAVAVWVLVGRSLRTVDRIRRQVARIDGARLNERVLVPRSRDEIEMLAATMNTMLDRIEISDRAQRAFVSDASHELRSPISTLVITGEVAAADPTGRTWVDMQDIVLAESRRMRALVEDLLTLAKVDAHGLALRRVEVDLDDVLDAEVRRLRAASTLTVRAQVTPARVIGDPDRLTQVIRNVADNAVRHASSAIDLRLEIVGDQVEVTIDNDGPVIPADQRARVFQRFVRLDDARSRDSGGSGLGLAISAAIVSGHQGRVEVSESERGWCRFTIMLPLATEIAVAPDVSERP